MTCPAGLCTPGAPQLVTASAVRLIDPTPFLSTIILASAGLVAIIGGLLVARFVSLDSDQRGSRKILSAARDRLNSAQQRADDARTKRLDWHALMFFRGPVLEAASKGVSSPTALIRLDDSWPFTAQELQPYASDIADEYEQARVTLNERGSVIDQFNGLDAWDKFRGTAADLPTIRWNRVWEDVFEKIKVERIEEQQAAAKHDREQRRREREKRTRTGPLGINWSDMDILAEQLAEPGYYTSVVTPLPQATDHGVTRARREDELRAADDRSRQQVEDYAAELQRLEQDHAEVVRPDARLWWGVVILSVFAALGVGIPSWVMSRGPDSLSSVQWLFWPFAGSLVLLIGYIEAYSRHSVEVQPDNG